MKSFLLYLTAFILLDAIVPAGCREEKIEPMPELPVSVNQITSDWNELYNDFIDESCDSIPLPLCIYFEDIDSDGRNEIFLTNAEAHITAFLCYTADSTLLMGDCTNEANVDFLFAPGYVVREQTVTKDRTRDVTRHYYQIANGKCDYMGQNVTRYVGMDGEEDASSQVIEDELNELQLDSLNFTPYYQLDNYAFPAIETEVPEEVAVAE